jgi:hypothetical protein
MALVKLNNRGVRSATAFGSITGLGQLIFIKKITASASGTVSFVDGASDVVLDDTYKEYLLTFNNIHPSANSTDFQFNLSVDTGSNYNVAKTTSYFVAYHKPATDGDYSLGYDTGNDLAQGTGAQILGKDVSDDNEGSLSGYLHLFDPSSTTFVKHFISTVSYEMKSAGGAVYQFNDYIAGYGNTTSAVDAIQFSMSSGNIDAGDICLYGVK